MQLPDPLRLGDTPLGPPVFLAPMAGITDLPFRRAVARFGAGLMVSEMVASTEMVTPRPSTRASVRAKALTEGTLPVSVQIAGREAGPMAQTARMVEDMGTRIIDINMGCPAKKVTGGLSGAALMRDLDHALSLIDAVVGAVGVPVTLKMRLGWDDDCRNAADLAARARDAGVAMLTVHGRTRAQFYKGQADWQAIRTVADLPGRPPLVANGDVTDGASARAALARS
ncbi:tRNA dihydrouridine synthase DusB, partial [Paracoccus liaowanqingii]